MSDAHFKEKMVWITPQLRAFARSLSGNQDLADDLVQDTLLRMWGARERFEAGTNFKAWSFTILRNQFYGQMRRAKFVGKWDEDLADRKLTSAANQDQSIWLADVIRALQELPAQQREALVLVGAGGVSYDEASEIMGVAIGTVKSRVNRARVALEAILEGGVLKTRRGAGGGITDPVRNLSTSVETLRSRDQVEAPLKTMPTLEAA